MLREILDLRRSIEHLGLVNPYQGYPSTEFVVATLAFVAIKLSEQFPHERFSPRSPLTMRHANSLYILEQG